MNNFDNIDQIIIDDEFANLDSEDSTILLEEEIKTMPLELREKVSQGEYL